MEHFIKNAYDQGAANALADFGITKEANKLLQSIEQLGIRGGKKGLMDHVMKNPRYLRGNSGKFKPETLPEREVANFLFRKGQPQSMGPSLQNRLWRMQDRRAGLI